MNRREFLAAAASRRRRSRPPHAAHRRTSPCSPSSIRTSTSGTSTKFKLAWFDPKTPEGKILGHSFTPKEYAEATKGLNVVKAVYMEVDVVPEQQQKEADYVIELCESGKTPTCAAVVSGRPNSDGFAKYAEAVQGAAST